MPWVRMDQKMGTYGRLLRAAKSRGAWYRGLAANRGCRKSLQYKIAVLKKKYKKRVKDDNGVVTHLPPQKLCLLDEGLQLVGSVDRVRYVV